MDLRLRFIMNQKGTSLIELMVTVSLMSIVAMGTMHMFENVTRNQTFAQTTSTRSNLRSDVSNFLLRQTEICKCNFQGKRFPARPDAADFFSIDQLILNDDTAACSAAGQVLSRVGEISDGLKTEEIAVSNLRALSSTQYKGDLIVHLAPTRKGSGSASMYEKFSVSLKVRPAGGEVEVVDCSDGAEQRGIASVPMGTSRVSVFGGADRQDVLMPGLDPNAKGVIAIITQTSGSDPRVQTFRSSDIALTGVYQARANGGSSDIRDWSTTAFIPVDGARFRVSTKTNISIDVVGIIN